MKSSKSTTKNSTNNVTKQIEINVNRFYNDDSYVIGVDPSSIHSAMVLCKGFALTPIDKVLVDNENFIVHFKKTIKEYKKKDLFVAIEGLECLGQIVGKNVFDTAYFIGRLLQICVDNKVTTKIIYRKEEKIVICHDIYANDSKIRQTLIDEFGEKGTKNNPGFFYGFSKDIWNAFAVAVVYRDKYTNYYQLQFDYYKRLKYKGQATDSQNVRAIL